MESDESYDYLFKIVLIGEAGVGKTCIVQRFKNGTFLEKNSSTIGVDFSMKTLTLDNKKVKVCIAQRIELRIKILINGMLNYIIRMLVDFTKSFNQTHHL